MDSQCQYAAIGRCEPMCLLISECSPLRFGKKRLIRAEMVKRGILSKEIAARLGISEPAVSQGCATSPRIVAALIEAGVPERVFGKTSPPSPPPGPKPGKIVFWDETNGAKACGGVK